MKCYRCGGLPGHLCDKCVIADLHAAIAKLTKERDGLVWLIREIHAHTGREDHGPSGNASCILDWVVSTKAEAEAALTDQEALRGLIASMDETCSRLVAKLEERLDRLTTAGDAMADKMDEMWSGTHAVKEWQKAKGEGR